MVGYNPLEKAQLSQSEYALAGAISGAFTRAICQPLDVIKIRFQLQVEPLKKQPSSKYHGVVQSTKCIIREEGWHALWKGHIPAQFLSVAYGLSQYSSFEVLTHYSWDYLPETMKANHRPLIHTLCGGVSACLASTLIHPLDVIRTRFVAQGEPKIYKSFRSAFQMILAEEGMRGFYKGLAPALFLVGPQMGFQFGLYSLFTGLWHQYRGIWPGQPPRYLESFICGSSSGFVAKLFVHPLDVVKKRLQVQGFEEARQQFGSVRNYNGMFHCIAELFREEGIRGLFKGLSPSLIKAGAVAGVNFCIYEQVRAYLIYRKSEVSQR